MKPTIGPIDLCKVVFRALASQLTRPLEARARIRRRLEAIAKL